jgi:plasmid stabilization system protein ParE
VPRVIITQRAVRGLERCRRFLADRNPAASRRAAETIRRHLQILEVHPEIGRPHAGAPELRELLIAFGDSGYVALYRHDPAEQVVLVLAFRHQKEAGY